jgi:hypothetical protein
MKFVGEVAKRNIASAKSIRIWDVANNIVITNVSSRKANIKKP